MTSKVVVPRVPWRDGQWVPCQDADPDLYFPDHEEPTAAELDAVRPAAESPTGSSPSTQDTTAHGRGNAADGTPTWTISGTATGSCGPSRGSHRISFARSAT